MTILNWAGKHLSDIEDDELYKRYFDSINLEKGIDILFKFNTDLGIDIILLEDHTIKAIHLYSGSQAEITQFTDDLPFDLNFSDSQFQTQQLLGKPSLSGGGDFSFLYGTAPIWDKYAFKNYSLHLQFSESLNRIELITISV